MNKEIVQIDMSAISKIADGLTDEDIENLHKKAKSLEIKSVDDKAGYDAVYNLHQIGKAHVSNVGKFHKAAKQRVTEAGKKMDVEKRRVLELLKPINDDLQKKRDAFENEKQRIESKKQQKREERHLEQIQQIIDAGAVFNGIAYVYGECKITDNDIWLYIDEDPFMLAKWNSLLDGVKQWKEKKDLAEAEAYRLKKEEDERQAKIAEENRIEKERLDKLKAEQDAREAKIKAEQDKIEAEKKAIEDVKAKEIADKKHAEEIEEAKKKAAADAKRKALEFIRSREREKIEAEELEKERAAELEKQRPDKEKLEGLLRALKAFPFPPLKTKKYQLMSQHIKNKLSDLVVDFNNKL